MSLFRRGPAKADALEAIEAARGVVEILKLSRARIDAAEPLLAEATALAERGSTAQAVELAEKAERIATTLEADHRAAADTLDLLRQHVGRLQELGLPFAEEQKALADARLRAKSTRTLEGVSVPDYAGALAIAKQALRDAEAKIGQSEKSADFLFAAELAVDGASEANGAPAEAVEEARALLTKARQAAREGRYELAATDAAVAEKIALGLVDQKRKARETLESVEKLVVGLRTAGVVVGSVQKSLDIGKALLDKGKVGAAIDVFNEAAQEAVALGTRYREVLNALSVATAAIDSLKSEGLASTEADLSLERAQAALQQGNYKLAASACEDAHRAAAMQRRFRDGLRSLIDETRERIKTLREAGVAYVNDAEEMVSKAEREFANGEYEATNEDLRIAGLLMGPPSEGKPKSGPTPP